ncbi:MAG TPA: hypothetical protein VFP39_15815 [Gemmatimonadales bacterium]|nr:hypothetical protein [Gemmatimonadales bacterium]
MRLQPLTSFLLAGLLAAVPARAHQAGLLLGYVTQSGTGRPEYRTMWLVLSPTEAHEVADVPDIVVPRATGFWRVGTTVLCGKDGTHEVVWQTPIGRAPVVAGTPCSAPDTSGLDTALASESAAADTSGCSADEARILFVSPTDIADQYETKQTESCEPRGGHWQDSNEVRSFDGDRVSLHDLLGSAAAQAYALAITRGYQEVTQEANCPPLDTSAFDLESWGIKHSRGGWHAIAMDNAVGGECEYEHAIDPPLPPRVTGDASLIGSWTALGRAIPGLTDYFTAPSGGFVVGVTARPAPGIPRELVAYTATAGTPQHRLLAVPFPAQAIVMAQWAMGRHVAAWTSAIEGIRNHPLPPVVGDHPHQPSKPGQERSPPPHHPLIGIIPWRALPNMRLKLAGLSLLRESECCALAGTNYRSTTPRPARMSPAAYARFVRPHRPTHHHA